MNKRNFEYKVIQVPLKEKFVVAEISNLYELEEEINAQAKEGWRLHTISTTAAENGGMFGGNRIHSTLVFEREIEDNI